MKKVSIYTTPTCTYCKFAKEFFTEHSIAYEEFNVGADPAKRNEMIELTGQLGVPVIRIGDDVIVGFNKPKVAELLGISEGTAMAA